MTNSDEQGRFKIYNLPEDIPVDITFAESWRDMKTDARGIMASTSDITVTTTDEKFVVNPNTAIRQVDIKGTVLDALTREPVTGSAYAVGEVTVARIERDALERLLSGKPELLQDLSQAIDERRVRAHAALTGEGNQSAGADA